jgi:hypothetical protein
MASLTQLDQGGTFRPQVLVWLGPSIGWVLSPEAQVKIVAAGVTVIPLGVTFIAVNVNGSVTIQLPAFKGSAVGQGVLPGQFVPLTITVVDQGGFAGAQPITLLPAAGETISGLASVQIVTPFGAMLLQADPLNGGCTVMS